MVKIRVQTCRRSCLCSLLVVLAPMKATHEKIGKSFTSSANNMHQGTSDWVFAIKSSITKADRWKNYVLGSDKMPEIQLGGHTIVSHGVKLARLHMLDWLIVVLLGTIELILKFVAPFNRFIGEDMMTDLKYPMKSNAVPFWAVQIVVLLLPFAIFSAYYYYRRDVYDFHHAILGLLFSVLVTGVITNVIKDAVGRPRPDFYWRCFPDGKPHYEPITGNVICHGDKSVIKEGRKSFPSGHTSWSFSGLGFLAWYLSGKIRVFDCQGHVAKLCLVILPLLVASLVGISRVDDYHHHWQDVFAGGLLGFMVASFCYLHFFPPPYDPHGWGPHAYFQMLAESPNSARSTSTYHFIQQPMENESVYIPPRYSA